MTYPLASSGEVDGKVLARWAYQRRAELQEIFKKMTLLDSKKNAVEEVIKRVSGLETSLLAGKDPMTVWDSFIEFLDDYDTGGWDYYLEKQAAIDKELQAAERRLARERFAALAAQKAVARRNKYPTGPNTVVGTVIAGLVDVTTGDTWVGTSGVTLHTVATHAVMSKLLDQTSKAEEWPVAACAEVDAMKQYLRDKGITSVKDIPEASLFFHAETWNDSARKWQGRSACKNCSQWFVKINAQRV